MGITYNCDNCDSEVQRSWKYCRFCGNRLDFPEEKQQQNEDVSIEQPKIEKKDEIDFDKELYYNILSSRAERSMIIKKKKEIRNEIDSLLDQVKSGLVDREYALPKIKELKKEVEQINKEQEKYSDIPEELPIEVLNDQIRDAEKRITKIEKLKKDDKVSKTTLMEAKKKAESTLEMLKDQQSKIFGHLRVWKDELQNNLKEVRKEVEHLYVKFKTEEITEDTYEERKENLISNIQNEEEILHILKQILD